MLSHDVQVLTHWLQGFLIVAAVCTTLFPLIYSFSPWYTTRLGRLIMLQAASFALAMDVTLLFQFWTPKDLLVAFWIEAVIFGMIAIATFALTLKLVWLRLNRSTVSLKLKEH